MLYSHRVQVQANPALILRWFVALLSGIFGAFLTAELLSLSPAPDPHALPPDFDQSWVGSYAWLCLGVTIAINVADLISSVARQRFINGFDGLVKDMGQYISAGHGVESAVHEATHKRGGAPARTFAKILHDKGRDFFEDKLHEAALRSNHDGFREAALLLEQSVRAGGNAGKHVQEIGEVLSQVRAMQERFAASTRFGVGLIKLLGLLIVPSLFSLLSVAMEFSIAPHATTYFAATALGIALLDWRISANLARGLMRLASLRHTYHFFARQCRHDNG